MTESLDGGGAEEDPIRHLGPFARTVLPVFQALAALLLATAVVVTSFQVISRFGFNRPYPWAEEVGRYLFVWTVYTGFLVAIVKGTHIRVTFLVDRLPILATAILDAVLRLVAIATFSWVAWLGYGLALRNLRRSFFTIPDMTLVWLYAAVPGAMGLAATILILEPVVDRLIRWRRGPES